MRQQNNIWSPCFATVLVLVLLLASPVAAQTFLEESPEEIIQEILPHSGHSAISAGSSGCGDGRATFFNNADVCASMGSRSPQPMDIESDCEFIALEARPIDRLLRFHSAQKALESEHARYLKDRMAVALNHNWFKSCLKFVIEGHVGSVGLTDDDQKNFEARVRQVVDILVTHGVDRQRLRLGDHGDANPTAPNTIMMRFRPELIN